jgi:hypothetical protein
VSTSAAGRAGCGARILTELLRVAVSQQIVQVPPNAAGVRLLGGAK